MTGDTRYCQMAAEKRKLRFIMLLYSEAGRDESENSVAFITFTPSLTVDELPLMVIIVTISTFIMSQPGHRLSRSMTTFAANNTMFAFKREIRSGMIKPGLVDLSPTGCIMAFHAINAEFSHVGIFMAIATGIVFNSRKPGKLVVIGKLFVNLNWMAFFAEQRLMFSG